MVVCDVEGYQVKSLDPSVVPAWGRTTILVELHDFLVPRITENLVGAVWGHAPDCADLAGATVTGGFAVAYFWGPRCCREPTRIGRSVSGVRFEWRGSGWSHMNFHELESNQENAAKSAT